MRRLRWVVAVFLAVVLISSLFFVPTSVAGSFGAELMQRFGGSSGDANGGTAAAPYFFGVPVTVFNQDSQPVPVTVQGGTDPITATIDDTVSTQDVNDPSAQPYQHEVQFSFNSGLGSDSSEIDVPVPAGKRLIIRYVSGEITTSPDGVGLLEFYSTAYGFPALNFIPAGSVEKMPGNTVRIFGLETWIPVDPGTSVGIIVKYGNQDPTTGPFAEITITGYLVDAPATP